jgi:hypothetical protein
LGKGGVFVMARYPLDTSSLQLLRAKGCDGDELERIQGCRSIDHGFLAILCAHGAKLW